MVICTFSRYSLVGATEALYRTIGGGSRVLVHGMVNVTNFNVFHQSLLVAACSSGKGLHIAHTPPPLVRIESEQYILHIQVCGYCSAICTYIGTRIQRNVLLEVCIVYVYSELRVVSLAAGKAFVDGVDGDGVWIICSCVRSGRWAAHSDSQKRYGNVFTGVWYDHFEYIYILWYLWS